LYSLVKEYKFFTFDPPEAIPTPDEFVQGSIRERSGKLELVTIQAVLPKETKYRKLKSFGKPLKS
jgi:hypothetical protein